MNACRITRRLCAALGAASISLAVGSPSGAADEISQVRTVPSFDRIRLSGAFTTDVTAGARAVRVVVSAVDRDLVDRVTSAVEGRTLVVGMRSGVNVIGRAPRLSIALPALAGLSNEGASSVRISGLAGGDLELSNAGAASLVATGRARRETITLDGTGRIDAAGVNAHDVSVDNNGVGSVTVRAAGALTMNVDGIGEIRYAGAPTSVESHVNGIGRIGRL